MLHLINQLLFWKKMYTDSNIVLYSLSRYAGVPSRFMAVASQYGIHSADCWNCQVCSGPSLKGGTGVPCPQTGFVPPPPQFLQIMKNGIRSDVCGMGQEGGEMK